MAYTAHVSPRKKKIKEDLVSLLKEYPVIGIVDMEALPASTLQEMRAKLRGTAVLVMAKKRLMTLAFKEVESEKPGVSRLADYYHGMPALLLTRENPFRIARVLRQSRTPAHARPGQIAPEDIVVKAGPTSFPPGPIISELSSIGLKTGVEGGKVAIKEDKIVVKAGEPVPPKIAEVLARLDIKPVELGLSLWAVYEDGVIYERSLLEVDEEAYLARLTTAAREAYLLAVGAGILTQESARAVLTRAAQEAYLLAVHEAILSEETLPAVLLRAEAAARAIQARIEG